MLKKIQTPRRKKRHAKALSSVWKRRNVSLRTHQSRTAKRFQNSLLMSELWPRSTPLKPNARRGDSTPKKKRKKHRKNYSTGELNVIVDSVLHPLYKKTELMRIVDGLIHAAIEQNPKQSMKKFVKYNASAILKKLASKS
jgi:hypothetical protein